MTVGIVTYHRSHNYGAMLQARALRAAIAGMGHEAFFVDYWPRHQKRAYTLFPWRRFSGGDWPSRLRLVRTFFSTLPLQLDRRRRFDRFFRSELAPFCRSTGETFDVLVFGSDQIWRKQPLGDGYNPVYFGRDPFRARRRISYAASMGTLPGAGEDAALVRDLVSGLDAVSVREEELQVWLSRLGIPGVALGIDPVLLPDPVDWEALAGCDPLVREPYLLWYDLQKDAFRTKTIYRYASARGLRVVHLLGTAFVPPSGPFQEGAGPREFLNLVRHAAVVATSSFHGVAFSVLFHRPFFASFREAGGRAASFLGKAGIPERLLAAPAEIPEADLPEPDWDLSDRRVSELRRKSLCWIEGAIDGYSQQEGLEP